MYLSLDQKDMGLLVKAAEIAKESTCLRKKCGAIIVFGNEIIGRGFNSPPKNFEPERRCLEDKSCLDEKVTDKTCCIHAEQRAIEDVLRNNPDKLNGSRLYYCKIDDDGNPAESGRPYCTICSKSAFDLGIEEWVLCRKKGLWFMVLQNTTGFLTIIKLPTIHKLYNSLLL